MTVIDARSLESGNLVQMSQVLIHRRGAEDAEKTFWHLLCALGASARNSKLEVLAAGEELTAPSLIRVEVTAAIKASAAYPNVRVLAGC